MVSPIQDGREPLNSINGVSPMLSGRIDPLSTPLYNGRNKLFPPVAPTTSRKQLVSPIVQRSRKRVYSPTEHGRNTVNAI